MDHGGWAACDLVGVGVVRRLLKAGSSATSCWAVGSYAYHATHRQAFNQALYWNGSHWSLTY